MNITKVDNELQGGARANQGETKKGTGVTAGLPPQSKFDPQQKDPHLSKLWDLDIKVQGSQKTAQRVIRWVPSGVHGQAHVYR